MGPALLDSLGPRRAADEISQLREFFAPLVLSEELEDWLELTDSSTFGQMEQYSVEQSISLARYDRVFETCEGLAPDPVTQADQLRSEYDSSVHRGFPFCLVPLWQFVDMVVYAEIGFERQATSRVFRRFQEVQLVANSLTDIMIQVRFLASAGTVPSDVDNVADTPGGMRLGAYLGLDDPTEMLQSVEMNGATEHWPDLWQQSNASVQSKD